MQGVSLAARQLALLVLVLSLTASDARSLFETVVDSASLSAGLRGASRTLAIQGLIRLDARDFKSAISLSERTVEITAGGVEPGVFDFGGISDGLYVGDGGVLILRNIRVRGLAVPNSRGSAVDDFMLSPSIQIGPGSKVVLSGTTVILPRSVDHADCSEALAALAASLSAQFQAAAVAPTAHRGLLIREAVEAGISIRSYGHTVGHSTLAMANSTLQCEEPQKTAGDAAAAERQLQGRKLQAAARQVFEWQAATAALGTAFAIAATVICGLLLARGRTQRRHDIALAAAQATGSWQGGSDASSSQELPSDGTASLATISAGSIEFRQQPVSGSSRPSQWPPSNGTTQYGQGERGDDSNGSGDGRHSVTQDSLMRDQHSHLMRMRMEGGLEGIEIGPPLGCGSYGKVYKGRWKGVLVAIKVIEHKPVGSALEVEGAREALLAASISHPNVCACYKICNVLITQKSSQRTDSEGFAIQPSCAASPYAPSFDRAPAAAAGAAGSSTASNGSGTSSVASIAKPRSLAGKQFAADIAATEAAVVAAAATAGATPAAAAVDHDSAHAAAAAATGDNASEYANMKAGRQPVGSPFSSGGHTAEPAAASPDLGTSSEHQGASAPLQSARNTDIPQLRRAAAAAHETDPQPQASVSREQTLRGSSIDPLGPSDGSFEAAIVEVVDMQLPIREAAATSSSDPEAGESTETWMLLEYADRGSLEQAISRRRFYLKSDRSKLDMVAVCHTLLDICSGLVYLHSVGLLHGDLKPANVLLKSGLGDSRGFVAKLADFGMSRMLQGDVTHISTRSFGTVPFMAPELLRDSRMGKPADVFSFGILMWSLLSGQSLYTDMTAMQVMWGVVQSGLRPDVPAHVPLPYAKIIQLCWAESPADRPTFVQLSDMLIGLLRLELEARRSRTSSLDLQLAARSQENSTDTPRRSMSLDRTPSSGANSGAAHAAGSAGTLPVAAQSPGSELHLLSS